MEFTLIHGEPYIKGEIGSRLLNIPQHDLRPGDRIIQMGKPGRNGKPTSSHRIDKFEHPITYCGMMMTEPDDLGDQYCGTWWMIFKMNPLNFKRAPDFSVFKLVIQANEELYVPNFRAQTIRIFKPFFVMF